MDKRNPRATKYVEQAFNKMKIFRGNFVKTDAAFPGSIQPCSLTLKSWKKQRQYKMGHKTDIRKEGKILIKLIN